MPPSVLGWFVEKELYLEFRVRVRPVLDRSYVVQNRTRSLAGTGHTPDSIADLCLRRVLTLQREVRRTALMRQREALASVARAAIETTIVGLYSLNTHDADWVDRLSKSGHGYLKKSMQPWFPEDVFEAVADEVDEFTEVMGANLADVPGMYTFEQLAERVDELGVRFNGDRIGRMLYREFYVPLSKLPCTPGRCRSCGTTPSGSHADCDGH